MEQRADDIITIILKLLPNAEVVVRGNPTTKKDYEANVKFISGSDKNGHAIFGDLPDEITFDKIKIELDKL
tara:strand:+ start:401 stop:613 length:213 start_codon:yes stop_codon:yes gene_type:complete